MTAFKNYLGYILKRSALRTVVFSLFSLITTVISVGEAVKPYSLVRYDGTTGIEVLATMLGIFATVIPVLETAGFKNRRNLDTLYFLPINRFNLALAHYISGLIQLLVIYTVSFIGAIPILLGYAEHFSLIHLIPYYFLSLLIGIIMYSFFIFVFGKANTVADGIICGILWMFAAALCMEASFGIIQEYFGVTLRGTEFYYHIDKIGIWGIVYVPINNLTMIYQDIIETRADNFKKQVEAIRELSYMFWVWGGAAVACVYGYFREFIKKGAEKAGEISDSWFCYKLLIPIYGIAGAIVLDFMDNVTGIIIVILAVIGYVIYRRSFMLKKYDIVNIAVITVYALGITVSSISGSYTAAVLLPYTAAAFFAVSLYRYISANVKRSKGDGDITNKEMHLKLLRLIVSIVFMVTVSLVFAFAY